jgi:hypothetical protein
MVPEAVAAVRHLAVSIEIVAAATDRGREAELTDSVKGRVGLLKRGQLLMDHADPIYKCETGGSPLDHRLKVLGAFLVVSLEHFVISLGLAGRFNVYVVDTLMYEYEPRKPVRVTQAGHDIPEDVERQPAQPHMIDFRRTKYQFANQGVKRLGFRDAIQRHDSWPHRLKKSNNLPRLVSHLVKIIFDAP